MTTGRLLQSCAFSFLLLAFVLSTAVPLSLGDSGTAAYYEPSPSSTQYCGDVPSQFPKGKNFTFVGEDQWDSGEACWREYDVWCDDGPGLCKAGSDPVRFMVLGFAADIPEVDFALPPVSFGAIANPRGDRITVQYRE
ncbi:hypothetical protein BT93_G1208 [Corymbia citriodora subsp. variegata]|nr:hypothetical protein BT93_G1208 [Corymbia citriodora subsp. variegata]KAF8020705.1 hypothetical protein BT93_G1208 [Corymbia citriodora subsp. variegata]